MSGPPPPIGKIPFFSALDLIGGSRFPRRSPAEEIPQSVPLDHRLVLPDLHWSCLRRSSFSIHSSCTTSLTFMNGYFTVCIIACKEAIEKSITKHFDGMCFDSAAVKEVLEEFGRSRTLFVLAVTVQDKSWDGRFSQSNKEWTKSFHIQGDRDSFGVDRRTDYIVNSHPAIVDGFIDETRRELARKPSMLAKLAENTATVKKTPPNHSAKSKQEVR